MLSPGQYYKSVPRDPVANLEFRRFITKRCLEEPEYRNAVRHACEQDFLFWCLTFVFQFNPKPTGTFTKEIGPFIPWDYQDNAVVSQDPNEPGILWCIANGEDMVIEKSRDMGASWLCLLVMLWLTLFHPWKKFTLVSKDADSVDKPGDSDSLFWKLDFVIGYLPRWLVGEVSRNKMMIRCERTNSTITGTASTGRAGVGGRATAMFVDEFSLIREDREIFGRTKDTTNCRIFNGTHYGTSGMFFDLCDSGSDIGRRIKKLQMHWSKHPDKRRGLYQFDARTQQVVALDPSYHYGHTFDPVLDGTPAGGPYPGIRSPWYDKEVKARGGDRAKRDIALHLDMDPKGSSNQFFDPITINMLKREFCREPEGRYDIVYDSESGRPLKGANGGSLVASPSGKLSLWVNLDMHGNPPLDVYAIGGDISAGTGATPSVFSIMNSRGEKVGQYFNTRIEPTPLAPLVVALCWIFTGPDQRGAKLIWEMNGPGVKFSEGVVQLGYRNIYYRVSNPWGLGKTISDMPGWYPSANATRVILEDYRHALQHKLVLNPCLSSVETCLDFVWKGGSIEHDRKAADPDESGARENHGDEVIADALTWSQIKDIVTGPLKKEAEKLPEVYSREWRQQYREMHAKPTGVWG